MCIYYIKSQLTVLSLFQLENFVKLFYDILHPHIIFLLMYNLFVHLYNNIVYVFVNLYSKTSVDCLPFPFPYIVLYTEQSLYLLIDKWVSMQFQRTFHHSKSNNFLILKKGTLNLQSYKPLIYKITCIYRNIFFFMSLTTSRFEKVKQIQQARQKAKDKKTI